MTAPRSTPQDMRCNSDSHGIAALDIDHDGHKDMFISTGADHGLGQVTNATSALLFWGRSPEEGDPAPIALYGGRDAALDVHRPSLEPPPPPC